MEAIAPAEFRTPTDAHVKLSFRLVPDQTGGALRPLVERFVATARRGGMGALVVVNKCDLEQEAVIGAWIAPLDHDASTNALIARYRRLKEN